MTSTRNGVIAWAAVVVPTWVVLILCTHWEPVAHDGWGHWLWHRNVGLTLDNLLAFAEGTYTHNNPRLGQVLTLLVFTPGPWHSIVTPIVELALFYLVTLLVLGRAPSLRRADDALLFAAILALAAVTVPSIGMMLFYRPFTGNYLFGLVINLALVVPYRLHYETPRRASWWWVPLVFVTGAAAGLSNEHTGPAFSGLLLLALVVFWRRDRRIPAWAIAGLLGIVAGGIALFLAPGQSIRYHGLATQASTLGRVIERGFADNAKIILLAAIYMLPAIVAVGLGVIARYRDRPPPLPHKRRIVALLAGALVLAIALTLLLSPKQGPRLYLASSVIASAGVASWVVSQLVARWSRAVAVTVIAAVLCYAGFRMTGAYYQLGREFRARVAVLEAAPDDSLVEIPVYSIKRTRWSQGDDLLIETIRNTVSASFGLALIRMRHAGPEVADPDPP